MRRKSFVAICVIAIAAVSCLDSIPTTPTSKDFAIVPLSPRGAFNLDISVRNTSSQRIYIDAQNLFVEKLVDQKWVFAYGPKNVRFNPNGNVDPAKSYVFLLGVVPDDSTPLLKNLRGVYRVHVGLSFDASGVALIDSALTYSTPFAIAQ